MAAATTTAAGGAYTFGGVAVGSFIVRATVTVAGRVGTGQRSISVVAGRDLTVPVIALVSPAAPSEEEEFGTGRSFTISVPFANAAAPNATTTVAQAFCVPPTVGTVENYRLFRFNALTREYEQLSAGSTIRRAVSASVRSPQSAAVCATDALERRSRGRRSKRFATSG